MRKLLSTAVALGVLASTSLTPMAYADVAVNALPTLDSAINANVTTNGSNMNVQITAGQGGVGTLNWGTYNIGKDAGVNYEFSAHNQTALNKVSASGGLSQIYGKITSSGCAGCGYDATGKVILVNPNGVLFGNGANVNLNSFTVTNMDATFDKDTNKLTLTKGANQKDAGITVLEGAQIYGDKNVTFASDNITVYNGSKISTNLGNNVGDTAYGKIKMVTSDGVNFTYYNNGAIKGLENTANSTNKMILSVNGNLESGNIDLRNYSTNANSEINLKDANLKAVKAVKGNDGNIWLTASNKIVVEDSTFTTQNLSSEAATRNGGNVQFLAGKKLSVGTSGINAVGNVDMISQGHDTVIDNTAITSAKDINVTASKIASVQNKSVLNGKNVTVKGGTRAQVANSTVKAVQDANIISDGTMAWTEKATIEAGRDVNVTANNGYLLLNNSTMKAGNNVNLKSKDAVTSAKLSGTTFTGAKDVNVESTADSVILTGTSQFVPVAGTLNLKGAKNVEINTTSDLTTAKTNITAGENAFLTSKEGNVNVTDSTKFLAAKKIYIQGAKDVKTTGTVDLNNIQTNIVAGNDVDVTLSNVGNRDNGLNAKAGNNMTVTTAGTLSVSSLISGKDMTINANKVIAGKPYTTVSKLPEDTASERSYIEVGGEFTSNVTNDNYEVTASGELTNDGKYNKKHHIQYGEDEKILLINKRPVDNKVTDPTLPDTDNGDDVDVVNPGDTPADPEPSTPVVPTPTPGEGEGNEGGNDGGNDDGNTPGGDNNTGDEPCPDTPDNDEVEDEVAPGLQSAGSVLSFTRTYSEQKRF